MPNASGSLVDRVQRDASAAGLEVYVLPRLGDLTGGRVKPVDIRRVEIGDVLGRHQIETDLSSIAGYLTGKRVLITGAGGSIGSELARQVHRFGPASLILLDRDESALHAVQLSIYGHGLLDSPETVLADIRDIDSLRSIFAEHRPEIVFHAAALKHLPMLERFPAEGWKTNVLGTLNLLEAVRRVRRRALRQHLHRQGRRRHQRAGLDQAARRAAHGVAGRSRPACPTCPCASATSWARGARCCTPSTPRSPQAARSPSPTPTSPATS